MCKKVKDLIDEGWHVVKDEEGFRLKIGPFNGIGGFETKELALKWLFKFGDIRSKAEKEKHKRFLDRQIAEERHLMKHDFYMGE